MGSDLLDPALRKNPSRRVARGCERPLLPIEPLSRSAFSNHPDRHRSPALRRPFQLVRLASPQKIVFAKSGLNAVAESLPEQHQADAVASPIGIVTGLVEDEFAAVHDG